MNKSIAILITCHNRKNKTLNCLKASYACNLPENIAFQVFLVDDGSTDGTAEAVKEIFAEVNIIKGDGNLYWNRGMHLAWSTAIKTNDYDYYLWLNDDTVLIPQALQELFDIACQYGNNVIVCGAICSEIDGKFTYGGREKSGKEILPDGTIQNCYSINGNCVLVCKPVIKKIGIIDPIFPHAIGDFEYGLRAIKSKIPVVSTRMYIGLCERNSRLPAWCYSDISLKRRINALYSPLGSAHPYYFFIFEKRHVGWFTAIKHYFLIHLRVVFPELWTK
jgi:GT2 family glycosyltransferase